MQLTERTGAVECELEHVGIAGVADDRRARGIREPFGGPHVDDDHGGLLGEQHLGDPPADPACGAGDDVDALLHRHDAIVGPALCGGIRTVDDGRRNPGWQVRGGRNSIG